MTGSCLCGSVRFEVDEVALITTCHCETCRKATGAAFATWAHVERDKLRWLAGREWVVAGDPPRREFCGRCGSCVPGGPEDWPTWSVPAGSLDGDPGKGISLHVFTCEKAPWWEIEDDLPQFEKWVPGYGSDPNR